MGINDNDYSKKDLERDKKNRAWFDFSVKIGEKISYLEKQIIDKDKEISEIKRKIKRAIVYIHAGEEENGDYSKGMEILAKIIDPDFMPIWEK